MKPTYLALALLLLTSLAHAGDGVVELSQERALAGNAELGDAPGFPLSLTAPGAYRLTGNLQAPAGQQAIELLSEGIDLNLGGFAVSGQQSCAGFTASTLTCTNAHGADGIYTEFPLNRVHNGSVQGFDIGVHLQHMSHVHNVKVRYNVIGIQVLDATIVTHCSAQLNSSHGIQTDVHSVVQGNQAYLNAGHGLSANKGSVVLHNAASRNGLTGFETLSGRSVIANNTSTSNGDNGFRASAGSVLLGNLATGNGNLGFWLNANAAYGDNHLLDPVSGGQQIGPNLCSGGPC